MKVATLLTGSLFVAFVFALALPAHAQTYNPAYTYNLATGNPYGGYTYNPANPSYVYEPLSQYNFPYSSNYPAQYYNNQSNFRPVTSISGYGYPSYYPSYTYAQPYDYYGSYYPYQYDYGYPTSGYNYGYNYGYDYGYGSYGVNPVNYSYPVPGTNLLGDQLCNWQGYGVSSCDFNPHQWVFDPYSQSWY